ncbi:MAG: UV DNA damage repair endonuclease UvsE [Actinobacteria bacterium]|nr:UV DNA damage repair endonuclease UvsE [Actinomycetota bacterium]
MKIGFAVKVMGRTDLPSQDTRRWQSEPDLGTSIGYLHRIFDHLEAINVRMYRMASGIAPYASHPDLKQFRDQPQRFASELAALGARSESLDLRLSMHPGQYTVLNSENRATVASAIEELEVHSEIMEAMGLGPEAVIVLHIGGVAGDKEAAKQRFGKGFARLSAGAQKRLVIENDDRSFSLTDVLEVSSDTGCPVVWDVLHHHCYDPDRVPDDEALSLAIETWPSGVQPKMHYSTPRTTLEIREKKVGRKTIKTPVAPPLRAHADMIDPVAFEWFLLNVKKGHDIDVMLEAKAKDLALLELRRQLRARGLDPEGLEPPG